MKYLVGIDIGTTGAKCGIMDTQGNLIASAYREYTCEYPQPNWVEQDVDMIVRKAFEAAKEALAASDIELSSIASISASTQRTCSIFLDENGDALKMISWQDNRTSAQVKDIEENFGSEKYYNITGIPLNTTWILTKILWVRENLPQLWEKTKKVVQLQDFFLKKLGADNYYIDIPDAVLYGMWDNDNFKWSDDIMDAFSISKSLLPVPTRCGTKVGTLGKQSAQELGLEAGIPVCVGAGDQNAAAIGAGVVEKGLVSVSIGTGGMAIAMMDHRFKDPERITCMGNHAIYGKWQIEGYQSGSAGVLRWIRDNIADLEKNQAQESGSDVYVKINEMISEVPAGAKGLLFLPFLASAAAPRWNPEARGTLIGLTFAHDKRHLARAYMEGITLEQKDILNSISKVAGNIDLVRIMGGAAKSELWCQMQADMYRTEVQTLKVSDAAIVGACILAGVGVGIFDDIKQGVAKMVVPDKRYQPKEENMNVYEGLYKIYCNAYEALNISKVYEQISMFQKS